MWLQTKEVLYKKTNYQALITRHDSCNQQVNCHMFRYRDHGMIIILAPKTLDQQTLQPVFLVFKNKADAFSECD